MSGHDLLRITKEQTGGPCEPSSWLHSTLCAVGQGTEECSPGDLWRHSLVLGRGPGPGLVYPSRVPCGAQVVNRLLKDHVYSTILQYGVNYDKTWIYDKIHHEINQFCSAHRWAQGRTALRDLKYYSGSARGSNLVSMEQACGAAHARKAGKRLPKEFMTFKRGALQASRQLSLLLVSCIHRILLCDQQSLWHYECA